MSITALFAKIFVWSFIFKLIKKVAFWFFVLSIGWVLIYKFVPVPYTIFMFQRCINQNIEGEDMRLIKDWVPLEEISNKVQLAVVCAEDQNFLNHNGFDFGAIKKAIEYNEKMELKGKNKRRGASTISQQTAKNVFLWHGRSWIRKGFEVYFTFLIELLWSKERIMEVYLNVIELGNGVYGVEAASQQYLKKSAIKLSPSDAALIAVVLPNPRKFSIANPSAYTKKRQSWCLRQMKYWGMKLDYNKEQKSSKKNDDNDE
jgi:monofunctional glycosyltransferase